MQTRGLVVVLTLTALLIPIAPRAAEVYKSVDADGNVVFSQQPPKDSKAEVVTPRYAKQPVPAAATPTPAGGSAAPAAPVVLTAAQKANKQQNCDTATQQLKDLRSPRANRLQYVNEKQERSFLTPEQSANRIKDAEDKIKQYCE